MVGPVTSAMAPSDDAPGDHDAGDPASRLDPLRIGLPATSPREQAAVNPAVQAPGTVDRPKSGFMVRAAKLTIDPVQLVDQKHQGHQRRQPASSDLRMVRRSRSVSARSACSGFRLLVQPCRRRGAIDHLSCRLRKHDTAPPLAPGSGNSRPCAWTNAITFLRSLSSWRA